MSAPKNSEHDDARDKGRHVFEGGQERFDIVRDALRRDHQHCDCESERSVKVSSRVISIPRNRNPPSSGSLSKSDGKPDAISRSRSFIQLTMLLHYRPAPVEQILTSVIWIAIWRKS